jgi:hypothetical protein
MSLSNFDTPVSEITAKVSLGNGKTVESQSEQVVPVTVIDHYEPPPTS